LAATHPTHPELLKFAEGGLKQSARKQLYTHLEHCDRCREIVEAINGQTAASLKRVTERSEEAATRQVTDLLIGQTLGEYRVVERLGQGGMGILYRAIQPLIGKEVAIKVMLAEIASDPTLVQRMIEEARAVNAARHKNIVDIFAFGQLPDGRPYMVMELLQGESLASLLHTVVRLPVEQAVKVLDQCFAGLEAAHAKGVIHRDLKPDNIYVDQRTPEWKVTLLDFGLALKTTGGDAKLTQPGTVVGTPAYMAPEQVRGQTDLSFKTDVYAMGMVAWTMLAGREPFGGGSIVEIMHRHLRDKPPPLRQEAPSVPPELEALVMQMLEKKPDDRPSDREVRKRLVPWLPGTLTSAPAIAVPPPTTKWMYAGLGIAAVVLAAVSAWVLLAEEPPAPIHKVTPVPKPRPLPTPPDPAPVVTVDAGPPPVVVPTQEEMDPHRLTGRAFKCSRITAIDRILISTAGRYPVFRVTFDDDSPLIIYDPDPKKKKPLARLHQRITACKGKPQLITAAHTRTVWLWLADNGEATQPLNGVSTTIDAVQLVPDPKP
jgi:eukaryotic-like serine/threonine-protein kinase